MGLGKGVSFEKNAILGIYVKFQGDKFEIMLDSKWIKGEVPWDVTNGTVENKKYLEPWNGDIQAISTDASIYVHSVSRKI